MDSLFSRWASLGIFVGGEIDPLEDPEILLSETLSRIHENGRFVEFIASWLARYGHLLLTKKLKFLSARERRLFSALIEESGTKEKKLLQMVQTPTKTNFGFLYPDLVPALQERTLQDPNPRFLRHGFYLKNYPLVREKIVLPPAGVYERSSILRNRALYGSTLRSDAITVLPQRGTLSVKQLAQELHVAWQSLSPIIANLERSGLVEWVRKGRLSKLRWIGPELSKAA